MSTFLKDDLTVALDDVDRTAMRCLTVYEDLAQLAADPDIAEALTARTGADTGVFVPGSP